jgi:hypothetical protein
METVKSVACTSCKFVNTDVTLESNCAQCGESLAPALLQQNIDELHKITERVQMLNAPSFNSFNGFGTMLLDYRSLPDGTYAATRWVTLLFLPFIPLSAYIIEPVEQERTYGRETSRFKVLSQIPLSATRILRTYLVAIVGVLPAILGVVYSREIGHVLRGWLALVGMVFIVGWGIYFIFFKLKNEGKAYIGKDAS